MTNLTHAGAPRGHSAGMESTTHARLAFLGLLPFAIALFTAMGVKGVR